MPQGKYISTKDAVRLTGLSINEIYDLIHSGKISAHKAPKSGWRIPIQELSSLAMNREITYNEFDEDQIKSSALYVADEDHLTKVFKMMSEVKKSLKIATANLKNFSVSVETEDQENSLRLCDFFMSLVNRGVLVQVVCMKPYGFYNYAKENCPNLLEHPLFDLRRNEQNHMKVFIFDDEYAYIGSANITEAAIGNRPIGKRNHEAGMLLCGSEMIKAPLQHFERVWEDPDVLKHTWKALPKRRRLMRKI